MSKLIPVGIATLALLVALCVAIFGGGVIEMPAGGSTGFGQIRFLDRDNSSVNSGDTVYDIERGQLSAGEDLDIIVNNSGITKFYDLASLRTTASTSANYRISVFASTTQFTINDRNDYLTLGNELTGSDAANRQWLLRNHAWATSTAVASTTSMFAVANVQGDGIAAVPSGGA